MAGQVIVERSNRHFHCTEETGRQLGYFSKKIINCTPLSITGEFATDQIIELPSIGKLRWLGPYREYNQIEVSMSEYFKFFGEYTERRESGDIAGARVIDIYGLQFPVIVPQPHIHVPTRIDDDRMEFDFPLWIADLVNMDYMPIKYCETTDNNCYVHLDNDQYNAFKGMFF